jgi:hypothetical protein
MGTTRNPGSKTKYINVVVRMSKSSIVIKSGGTTFEIPLSRRPEVYILPRELKEAYGWWNAQIGQYVTLTKNGEVIHVPDNMLPSNTSLIIKYVGESAERFISLLRKVMARYYRGGKVMKLPLSDKDAFRLAVCLARMSNLETISDVV